MGCNMKIIETVLGRMFLSISWLKWFIVAYSTIALYVFFYKEQMCPCLALFLFVWFMIKAEVNLLPGQIPLWRFGKAGGSVIGLGYQPRGGRRGGRQHSGTGRVCNGTEAAAQSGRKSRQTCKQQVLRAGKKKSKSGTICLPLLYKLCSDNSKKWVLAFFFRLTTLKFQLEYGSGK